MPSVTEVIPPQLLNAYILIIFTELGNTKSPVRPLHLAKAAFPMNCTESGIINVPVKPLQPVNACVPILTSESGSLISVSSVQSKNAISGIIFTFSPKFTVDTGEANNADPCSPPIIVQFLALKLSVCSARQYPNAKFPILVMESGIVTSVSVLQS